jgi:hypothetical protein
LTKWPLADGSCRQLVDNGDYMPVTALPHYRIAAFREVSIELKGSSTSLQ